MACFSRKCFSAIVFSVLAMRAMEPVLLSQNATLKVEWKVEIALRGKFLKLLTNLVSNIISSYQVNIYQLFPYFTIRVWISILIQSVGFKNLIPIHPNFSFQYPFILTFLFSFGVCCIFIFTTSGSIINQNNTYIQVKV